MCKDINKTILIYGAAGFVAQSLVAFLLDRGFQNLILVDRNEIPQKVVKLCSDTGGNIETLLANELCTLKINREIASLICLAGSTSVDAALNEPRPAISENVRIAIDVAEWTRSRSTPTRVIYMSSDEVLGESSKPLKTDAPLKPTQPYAASKAAAEVILHNYRDVYNLNIVTIRSCNLVGKGQKDPKLIPVSVRNLLAGTPIPIHGNGEQLREWMAVEDICAAIVTLLDKGVLKGIYHASSGVHYSVNQVVAFVADALRKRLRSHTVKDRKVQDACYSMDASSLHALGWKPRIDPKDAIRKASVEMAREYYNEPY